MAVNFAKGKGFVFGEMLPFSEYRFDVASELPPYYAEFKVAPEHGFHAYRTVGYPLFLGIIYRCLGVHPRAVKYAQLCLLLGVASFVPFLTLMVWNSRASYMSGLLGSTFFMRGVPAQAIEILAEPLMCAFVFLWVIAFFLMKDFLGRRKAVVVFGALTGVLPLIKGTMVFVFPATLSFLAISFLGLREATDKRAMMLSACFFILGFLGVTGSYSAYGSRQSGRLIYLSTQGPLVF